MAAVLTSAFDAALWFIQRSRRAERSLQPVALQQLLFLAQVAYASLYGGRLLMPAHFVADETGAIEPNVHAAYAAGPLPAIGDDIRSIAAETVLEQVWRAYGSQPAEALVRITAALPAFRDARQRGHREAIDIARLGDAAELAAEIGQRAAAAPRLLRTQSGNRVRVAAWRPAAAAAPSSSG